MGNALETARAIAAGERSAAAEIRAALDRIDAVQPELNAFVDVFADRALERARAVDAAIASGRPVGPLAGVPVAVKDNICLDHGRTTCASRMLESYQSPFTATAARLLEEAGAIVVAKANLDEFAMGGSGEHSAFGPARNPWDAGRVPGGSSSGSAAAVAAGAVPVALGSDTGGSVRQPAAFCGLVGVKPTYGRISRYGLVAFASSLDQIGVLATDAADAAAVLSALCGHDPLDSTSAPRESEDFAAGLDESITGERIAVVAQPGDAPPHPALVAAVESASAALRDAGVSVEPGDLPHTDYGIAAYYLIATAEASSNLARYDGVRYGRRADLAPGDGLEALYVKSRSEGFGPEVQRRILLGTHALSRGYSERYYARALRTRRLIKRDFEAHFDAGARAVLMPTTPGPAFRLHEKDADPMQLYLEDAYTVGASLAGLPAVSVPAGYADVDGTRLPIGVQLVGRPFDEAGLLRIARAIERTLGVCAPSPMRAGLLAG
ncbi:MAG: Asp-tRNA(Asn)/Glu-tRNA(Gln) amidotransferase subunit GatA [Planctomycetota bacterium]